MEAEQLLTISSYSVEFIKDPFGILAGKRYEFLIDIELDEEDELYSSKGIYLRVVYRVEGEAGEIIKHDIIEKESEKHLDFELEDEELQELAAFCAAHYGEAEE
ncbi:DUF6509 family protein [Paenibacillus sp. NEAU-GSW1]|uniref:DUF6509 family protein n=1 Tax=Paenibacillus sp. NEAU-GSW1 TaxID=2682486 RepID=UPI0012E1D0FD|nr:DUF6509 family protein [Paenibacillus sp. NEAU-GSW1]MUT67528.1 pullulanase [Paenibacillus sp. NEAU-GSW1]